MIHSSPGGADRTTIQCFLPDIYIRGQSLAELALWRCAQCEAQVRLSLFRVSGADGCREIRRYFWMVVRLRS